MTKYWRLKGVGSSSLHWVHVNSTKDLLAIRAKQLSRRDEYIGEASAKTEKARLKAAEYFFQKNKAQMTSGDYEYGTMVLVWNNALNFTFGNKGALCWSGLYIVVQRRSSGAYVLAELDGTVLSKPFAAHRLKLYHYRNANEPIVRFEWKHNTDVEITNSDDKESEITGKGNFGADNITHMAINRAKKDKQPGIPRPWELCGKDTDEYWQCVYQDVVSGEMKKRADDGRLAPWEEELLRWMENDAQFWNYKDDFKDMKLDEIPEIQDSIAMSPIIHMERRKRVVTDWQA